MRQARAQAVEAVPGVPTGRRALLRAVEVQAPRLLAVRAVVGHACEQGAAVGQLVQATHSLMQSARLLK